MGSNPGDLVLDPTCGSGTTPAVASKTGRRWIACDISPEAISSTKKRLLSDQKNCKVKYNNKEACYSDKVLEKVVKKLVYGENFIIIDNYANYIKHPFIVRRINHK